MVGWIVLLIVLLWMAVMVWRAIVFVANDMLESWRNDEEYNNEIFASALGAGLLHGLAWPITAPAKAIGSVLYQAAFARADAAFRASGGKLDPPELDITGELAKVEDEPIPETRAQARLKAMAEAARADYQARRLNDETNVGTIPAYTGRHGDDADAT